MGLTKDALRQLWSNITEKLDEKAATIDLIAHTENKNKFLDDMTVEELESKLNVKIVLTSGDGGQLLRDILGVK